MSSRGTPRVPPTRSGVSAARGYGYDSGAAPASVVVPDGKIVVTITVFPTSGGAGATVVIFGGATIPVPDTGTFTERPDAALLGDGSATIDFAGDLSGWFVSWRDP